MTIRIRSRDEHFAPDGPKRILTLDGGGVRGVLTLGVLEHIEALLRKRHAAGDEFRLSHYFDLVAGTSTGAIIAAALARGMSVGEVQALYLKLAREIFQKSLFRQGVLRAKYSAEKLTAILQEVFGPETTLGSDSLQTGLLVVMKRADTGSPWPVSNNPKGRYYAPLQSPTIANRDYPLWAVVRASTAAPSFFEPELLTIARGPTGTVTGTFVDGGVSTANNPSLLALRFATLTGYGVSWKTGVDDLLLISVGTGARNPEVVPSNIVAASAIQALVALMDDCNAEIETMLQWMSRSNTARDIDREILSLEGDRIGGQKLLTYQRYNAELSDRGLNQGLELGLDAREIEAVQEMDAPENVDLLLKIGRKIGERVVDAHFPAAFDLPGAR